MTGGGGTRPADACGRRVGTIVAAVLVALSTLIAAWAPAGAATNDVDFDLADLLELPGDRFVTIPDGTYEGVTVRAPREETDGPLGGWLVLQAATKNGVTITGDLVLEETTSRILFVGVRFENARVFNHGTDIAYWYTDHVYPDEDWFRNDRPIPRQFFVRYPATDVSVYGSDFHDAVASPINVSGVDRLALTGVRIWDVAEPPESDPEDLSHINTISLLGGDVTDMRVTDSTLVGARANHQTDQGDVVGLRYENVWYTGAFGTAFQFNATNGNSILDSARIDVRSWGHSGRNPRDRVDIVDGQQLEPGVQTDRVEVQDVDVVPDEPTAADIDPAEAWRTANPYDGWKRFFGWPDVIPEPAEQVFEDDTNRSPFLAWAVGAPIALVGVVVVVMLLRRRRVHASLAPSEA